MRILSVRTRSLGVAIISFALLLRILVGVHPHSGQDDYQGPTRISATKAPAKYGGDYEAQRHWMELTYHLPISEWYYHDLEYWGLDYPPLTAYVSWACGWAAHNIGSFHDKAFGGAGGTHDVCTWDDAVCADRMQKKNKKGRSTSRGLGVLKDLVALHSSRWGFEESGGKLYIRFTVLLLDSLVYMSAVWAIVVRLTKEEDGANEDAKKPQSADANKGDDTIVPNSQRPWLWLLLSALLQPALILIDHGHFQYNAVSLGLFLWSLHFMTMDAWKSEQSSFVGPVLGSVLFSLALNFKQMELYHAPAIFAYLLGRCFRRQKNNIQSAGGMEAVGRFFALGLTVILTFAVLWAPFAMYPRAAIASTTAAHSRLDGIMQILRRLFPFNRGIFEGKVANLWCALSVKPFSIRQRLPSDLLPLAALGLTLVLILPPCWILFKVGRGDVSANGDKPPSKSKHNYDVRLLLWGTAATSLAFFLASFQVHEKGILIPLAPISLLMTQAPHFASFFALLSTWSLWPLLVIDRLTDAYFCCLVIYLCMDSMIRVPLTQLPSYDEKVDIFSDRYVTKYIPTLGYAAMVLLHLLEWFVVPPQRLPDLFPVLWSLVGCGFFCLTYLATLWAMATQCKAVNKQEEMQRAGKGAKARIQVGESFVWSPLYNTRVGQTNVLYLSSADLGSDITPELLAKAKNPLPYEVDNAREAKPILNLSARDPGTLSLADGADEYVGSAQSKPIAVDRIDESDYSWKDGRIWKRTEQELMAMGVLSNGDSPGSKLTSQMALAKAPQLLRLPTSQVVAAAAFLLSYPSGGNSTTLVEADPGLLSYCAGDLRYGVEDYLPTMMFMGNQTLADIQIQTQLSLMPSMAAQIVRMGVDGGLQERMISRALGSASQASGKAVEGVVAETGRSYREYKRLKGGKGSLG
ncbi:hypothetical protein ACHAXT_012273 [Thalassiosira profunda]